MAAPNCKIWALSCSNDKDDKDDELFSAVALNHAGDEADVLDWANAVMGCLTGAWWDEVWITL